MKYDLKKVLVERYLSIKQRFNISLQFTDAMRYMHYKGCSHNDFKPQNILINEENGNFKAKLSDFGTMLKTRKKDFKILAITLEYAAPEIILSYLFSNTTNLDLKSSDVWSLGLVLNKTLLCSTKEIKKPTKFIWSTFLSKQAMVDCLKIEEMKIIIEKEKKVKNKYNEIKQKSN